MLQSQIQRKHQKSSLQSSFFKLKAKLRQRMCSDLQSNSGQSSTDTKQIVPEALEQHNSNESQVQEEMLSNVTPQKSSATSPSIFKNFQLQAPSSQKQVTKSDIKISENREQRYQEQEQSNKYQSRALINNQNQQITFQSTQNQDNNQVYQSELSISLRSRMKQQNEPNNDFYKKIQINDMFENELNEQQSELNIPTTLRSDIMQESELNAFQLHKQDKLQSQRHQDTHINANLQSNEDKNEETYQTYNQNASEGISNQQKEEQKELVSFFGKNKNKLQFNISENELQEKIYRTYQRFKQFKRKVDLTNDLKKLQNRINETIEEYIEVFEVELFNLTRIHIKELNSLMHHLYALKYSDYEPLNENDQQLIDQSFQKVLEKYPLAVKEYRFILQCITFISSLIIK